jgi:alkylation response protein AidB-like acyl-CoA dehydrogenase
MELSFTSEHEELRQTVRRFMENQSSEQVVRRVMETEAGYDAPSWARMASELSLPGLLIPEKFGGAGLSAVEAAIVMEEMGRVLYCGPYLSTLIATEALLQIASDQEKAKLLGEIASGKSIATLAVAEAGGKWNPESIAMTAKQAGEGFTLDGVKSFVLDGHNADVILVAARAGSGLGLFRVDKNAKGMERAALPTLDLTRKLAKLTFAGTPATQISTGVDISAPLRRVLAIGIAMLAAEQVGGAQKCLEMSTEYAKTRLQFGRPIGSFQAIKHKCADMLVETEFARSAAYNAAFIAASGESDDELPEAASIAKSYCSEAYFHAAAENIQIHGGMGFTWEHPAHLYFKRARANSILFGDPASHRQQLAAILRL